MQGTGGPDVVLAADYFTDPICSWSWGNEPLYRALRFRYGDVIQMHHRMGGLVKERSEQFYDPQYDLGGESPEAYAKHQGEVAEETGMPIDTGVWQVHPPHSSHPACLAVKAVGLQGAALEDAYLRRVREAFFTERRPVDTCSGLMAIAAEVPGIDLPRLAEEIEGTLAQEAFARDFEAARNPLPGAPDIKETEGRVRYGFPTLILVNTRGDFRILGADHRWPDYTAAVAALAPEVVCAPPPDVETFMQWAGRAAGREVAVVCELSDDAARKRLQQLERDGLVTGRPVGSGWMWRWAGEGTPAG